MHQGGWEIWLKGEKIGEGPTVQGNAPEQQKRKEREGVLEIQAD